MDAWKREVTLNEMSSAFKSIAHNGSDDLFAEFHETVFSLIGSDLVEIINYAFENEK